MSEASKDEQIQGRISLDEVPEQISRIFFGGDNNGGGSSSYDSGYYYNNNDGYYNGQIVNNPNNVYYYPGYADDIELLIKLGQAALIVFMILAFFLILFLLVWACLYCCRRGNDNDYNDYDDKEGIQPRAKHHFTTTDHGYENQAIDEGKKSSMSSSSSPRPLIRQPGLDDLNAASTPKISTPKRRPSSSSPSTSRFFFGRDEVDQSRSRSRSSSPQRRRSSSSPRKLPSTPTKSSSSSSSSSSASKPRSITHYENPRRLAGIHPRTAVLHNVNQDAEFIDLSNRSPRSRKTVSMDYRANLV